MTNLSPVSLGGGSIYSSFVNKSECFASKTVLTVTFFMGNDDADARGTFSAPQVLPHWSFLSCVVWLFETHISVTGSHDEQTFAPLDFSISNERWSSTLQMKLWLMSLPLRD